MNCILGGGNMVEMRPVVSVIMPCYNSEETVIKALNSLEKQTYQNFEVIIINDGSTDRTASIIENYIIQHKELNIRYYEQNNRGVSIARNHALEKSNATYISFLDSDDTYNENFILNLVSTFEKFDCDVACASYTRFDEELTEDGTIKYYEHMELLENFMHRTIPVVFCSIMYKKSILDDNKIYFTQDIKYGEDSEFVWKFLSNCNNGCILEQKLYYYYDNPESASNNVNWDMIDSIESIKRVKQYLKSNNDLFFDKYSAYMSGRGEWAVAKKFSLAKDKKLYKKLISQYDVKTSMKSMLKGNQKKLVRLSALLYLISPKLYFYMIYLGGKLHFK